MTNSVNYWIQYKTHVERSLGDFGDQTPVILTFGLASEVCEVFDVTQKELIKGKRMTEERISELGDILWYIAAIELFYSLPYPRYANYLGIPFEITNAHEINLVNTQSQALAYASEISASMAVGDADEIQYNLNKMLAVVFDICMVYGINIIDCLQSSVNKIAIRHGDGFDANAKKDYKKEFQSTKVSIKDQNAEEILLQVKFDNRNKKNPYKSIVVKAFGEDYTFEDGDIIVDFFRASNFIGDTFKDKDYLINYSPNFREFLDANVDTMYTGYIVNEELISASDMRKRMKQEGEGNVVFAGKSARPILMTPDFKELGDLLDYIMANRKGEQV